VRQVLTSSTNSNVTGMAPMVSLGIPLNFGKNPELVPNTDSDLNKKCIEGLAEGKFNSYYKNRINPDYIEQISDLDKKKTVLDSSIVEGKIFVVGNGRFLDNAYDSIPLRDSSGYQYRPNIFNNIQKSVNMKNLNNPHFFGNQEFHQNIIDYMMGETSVRDLRSRHIEIHAMDNEKIIQNSGFYKTLNLVLPILLILALAFKVNYLRKKKYPL